MVPAQALDVLVNVGPVALEDVVPASIVDGELVWVVLVAVAGLAVVAVVVVVVLYNVGSGKYA